LPTEVVDNRREFPWEIVGYFADRVAMVADELGLLLECGRHEGGEIPGITGETRLHFDRKNGDSDFTRFCA
jgi:hypothetical protein